MKVKPIKIKIKQPTPSAADRLYAKHQAIRKAKGLPDPSEYKKKLEDMKEETELNEISAELKSSYKSGAKKQIKELQPWTKKGEYKDLAKNIIAKRKKGIAKVSEETEIDEQLEKKGRFVSGPPKKTFKAPTIVSPMKEAKDAREYDYEGDMATSQLRSLIFNAEDLIDMMDDNTNLPEWVQSKITLAEDYISTAANYLRGELTEEVNLNEGRPSQRHPLEGHEYHKKTNAELEYIGKDAHKAAEAMKSHNTTAENKYRDQANDAATVRYFRKKSGTPDWYKKKYGLKEEADEPSMAARTLSRKAQIVKMAAKSKKEEREEATDKFQKDPELSSDIQKT